MSFGVLLLLVIVGVFVYAIAIYNRLIRYIEAIRNNERQIDIQLDRRFKVFENLIEVVKKYMDYEQSTLKQVIALRSQAQTAQAAGDSAGRIAAETQISKIMSGINIVFEQYPDLKANQNALQLQEEIVSTENKLTFAKQAFNDSVETYNAEKKMFFQAMVVSVFSSKLDKTFPYWQLSDEDIKAKEDYQVKM